MKNFRPGYLAGFQGLTPKSTRYKRATQRPFGGLGAFGKGAFVPMPNAPPGGVPIEDAIDTTTGQTYVQDPRCPEGEKMVSKMEPCVGQDCCDGGDCDPEGTPYPEEECEDDPNFQQKPQPVEPPPQAAPQQQAPVQASQPEAAPAMDNASAEAELARLEQEAAAAAAIVTEAPATAPPSAYTPSAPTFIPPVAARRPATPSDQEKISQLVEQYRGNRPIAAPRPRAVYRPAAQAPISSGPSMSADIFGWLKHTLFGSGNGMEGLSDTRWQYAVSALVILATVWYTRK